MGRARLDQLGGRLRDARLRLGMTQADLAEASGFHVSAISKFENGRREPILPNLKRLAETLGVGPVYLLSGLNPEGSGRVRKIGALKGCQSRKAKDDGRRDHKSKGV